MTAAGMPALPLCRSMQRSMWAVALEAVPSAYPIQVHHEPRVHQQMVSLRSFTAAPARLQHTRPPARQRTTATAGQDGDADFAVFRFTLGIPGFDDDMIPRVVGCLGAVLLIANHIAAGSYTTAAQGRAEALGAIVAAACVITPSVQARLKQMQPGQVWGGGSSGSAFLLAPDLPESSRQELAWASYALLRNTNVSGMLVWHDGKLLAARGSLGVESTDTQHALSAMADGVDEAITASAQLRQAAQDGAAPLYLPDLPAMQRAGADRWKSTPPSAQSVLAISLGADQPVSGGGRSSILLLYTDQPRRLSQRQRSWAAAIALKLGSMCS